MPEAAPEELVLLIIAVAGAAANRAHKLNLQVG